MNKAERIEFLSRDHLLKMLSDDEVASVSTAETAVSLKDGEEFLDLEQLGKGVQHADGTAPAMGRVLPRKAVHADTWNKIQKELASLGDSAGAPVKPPPIPFRGKL